MGSSLTVAAAANGLGLPPPHAKWKGGNAMGNVPGSGIFSIAGGRFIILSGISGRAKLLGRPPASGKGDEAKL